MWTVCLLHHPVDTWKQYDADINKDDTALKWKLILPMHAANRPIAEGPVCSQGFIDVDCI